MIFIIQAEIKTEQTLVEVNRNIGHISSLIVGGSCLTTLQLHTTAIICVCGGSDGGICFTQKRER